MNLKHLSVYLNDHLAGATAGSQLAYRIASQNSGLLAAELQQVATEIDEDRQALRQLIARFGLQEDKRKIALAWIGEKIGRLKRNGAIAQYTSQSQLLEIETLRLGVWGKLSLWENLHLIGVESMQPLIERAEKQHRLLLQHQQKLARTALTE